jgi:YHS domain-containing protein
MTWKSGKSHSSADHFENGHSRGMYYFASSDITQALLRRLQNSRAMQHTHMVVCIKHMPHKSIGATRGNHGNHIYPRITVKMGILERLYFFASSKISQAFLRRLWNFTAIWRPHMVVCIKHMPHKSMGARRGNQGNHIYPRITVKMGILKRLYYFASS